MKNLKYTKKRLTLIFTLLVFLIAIILEIVFFSAKYFHILNSEKTEFKIISESVDNWKIEINDLLKIGEMWREIFDKKDKISFRKWLIHRIWSFIIINNNDKNVVFSNINYELSDSFIDDNFINSNYNKIVNIDWFLINKINFKNIKADYDIIFLKKMKYSLVDYLWDLIWFVFMTIIFSTIFYYIWLKFVDKTLKPVEENLKDMSDFIHNAGHELKTPISVIHWNLQLLNEIKNYDKELTNESFEEINRLNWLIEWLIKLSNINTIDNRERLNIKDQIDFVIKDYKIKLEEKKIDLRLDVKNNIELDISREYFYIFFSNLLSNAIKYNKNNWKIEIILEKNKLFIKDTWIWIENEKINKIFDRFFRCENARSLNGFGIWLSLVKKISYIYNWKIEVKSEIWEWTNFIVKF